MERVMGIEPTSSAWKAEVLPLNYTRATTCMHCTTRTKGSQTSGCFKGIQLGNNEEWEEID